MTLRKNPDTGQTVAIVALLGAVGFGLYKYFTDEDVDNGWKRLSSDNLPVTVSLTNAWILLAQEDLFVSVSVTNAWVPLAQRDLFVVISVTNIWVPLSIVNLTVPISITYNWVLLDTVSLPVKLLLPTTIGFVIAIMSGNYPTAKYWYAEFNQRYYAWFLPVTELWQGNWDMGMSGEPGTLIVELYDANYNMVKQNILVTKLVNGNVYEFYPNSNQLVNAGQF